MNEWKMQTNEIYLSWRISRHHYGCITVVDCPANINGVSTQSPGVCSGWGCHALDTDRGHIVYSISV